MNMSMIQIGDNLRFRYRGTSSEIARAEQPFLLARENDEQHRAFRAFGVLAETLRDLDHGGDPRSVVHGPGNKRSCPFTGAPIPR